MFKKQGFFNKQLDKSQKDLEDSVSSKFVELDLDEVDQSICKPLQCISAKPDIKLNKTFSTPFKCQTTKLPDKNVALVSKCQNITSKHVFLFPENKTSKSNTPQPPNSFYKYIQPVNLEILLKWELYATKSYEFNIDEIIEKYAKKEEIKKLIPNKYALGNDIVPYYLCKESKKSKPKKSVSKSELSIKSLTKAFKTFKGYIPNETNLSFIGFPKSGKSTIFGNILLYLEILENDFIKKTEWEATKSNSLELKTAWLLDSSENERFYKETISTSSHYVEINNKSFNIFDCPGKMCYYTEIIKALVTSDSVMFTINLDNDWCSKTNEFINSNYVYFLFNLFKVFSIDKVLLIFVNCANFDVKVPLNKIYNICKKLSKCNMEFVFIENISNIQITEIQSIINHINSDCQIKPSKISNEIEKPFLLEVQDVFKPIESNLPVIVGRIIRGAVCSGLNSPYSKVLIGPDNVSATVKSLKIQEKNRLVTRTTAFAGHLIEITLPEITLVDKIKIGSYITHPETPLIVNQHFQVQMMIFDCDINVPIINGIKIFLWCKSRSCFCELTKMISVEYYENKNKITKKSPRIIQKSGCIVTAHITTEDLLSVEFHSEYKLDVFLLFAGLKLFSAGKFLDIVN